MHHDRGQQLVQQTAGHQREIDQHHFNGDLRQVVRVRQVGGDEQLEVVVVRYDRVTDLYHGDATLRKYRARKQRVQSRVQFGADVFDQTRFAGSANNFLG